MLGEWQTQFRILHVSAPLSVDVCVDFNRIVEARDGAGSGNTQIKYILSSLELKKPHQDPPCTLLRFSCTYLACTLAAVLILKFHFSFFAHNICLSLVYDSCEFCSHN